MIGSRLLAAACACATLLAHVPALAQSTAPLPDRRESMWPAPTAEDWKKPTWIQWQRTFDDALAVARRTGKPILLCINMDGEVASEHYAGVRYRQPEIAKLYEPYVCVIASVYRHNPRDYDEQGRRIACPRFGGVTCGEHIAIEPILFGQFLDDKRIAPRHIMIELDKREVYDVYYALDTDSVFTAIREGVKDRPPPHDEAREDRPLEERVASADSLDRSAVEEAFARGDRALRQKLLQAALAVKDLTQLDLLRQALRSLDLELVQMARRALAQANSEDALDLIAEALRAPMPAAEREALIVAVERIGKTSVAARALAAVQRGLQSTSETIDVERWTKALASSTAQVSTSRTELASRVEYAETATEQNQDPAARLAVAEATLALALESAKDRSHVDRDISRRYAPLLFEDAYRTALAAEKQGAQGWRLDATLAVAAFHLGRQDEAETRAESAVRELPPESDDPYALRVLELFGDVRAKAIRRAWREKRDFPPQWLADANSAYSVVERQPGASAELLTKHYDLLFWSGGRAQATKLLDEGLLRFPASPALHERLRARVIDEHGAAALEGVYAEKLARADAAPELRWFAGYAALVCAEYEQRANHGDEATSAYTRAIGHFERYLEPLEQARTTVDASLPHDVDEASADHFIALALAGRAWIASERNDFERAVNDLVASFERRPEAAATLDGLNRSPATMARWILARVQSANQAELAAKLEAAMKRLDPALLERPAFDRGGPQAAPSTDAQRFGTQPTPPR